MNPFIQMRGKGRIAMFTEDYLMNQIEGLTRMLARIMFQKGGSSTDDIFEEEDVVSETGLLMHRLKKLLYAGDINEAENMLFEELDEHEDEQTYLAAALAFYKELATMDEAFLEAHDFSREEIEDGVSEVRKRFGLPGS